jgi:ribose transport system permease protein
MVKYAADGQTKLASGSGTASVSSVADVVRMIRGRRESAVFMTLVVIFVGLSFYSEFFLTSRNLANVARQISVVGIVSLGQALVIICGGIDLSVGSIIGLSAVLTALVAAASGSPLLGIVTALAAGTAVGVINGLLVARVKINPFITTLGTLSVARGAALLVTNGSPVRFNNWAAWPGYGKIGVLPFQFILLIALSGLVWFFAARTRWGRNIYAVGDNARASRLAGVNVRATRITVFVICGALSGLGGLLLAGMLTNTNPSLGQGYELDVIAAVILGGVAMSGGRGSVPGVVVGAALMGLLRNAFVLLNVSGYWQTIAIGLVVILAVGADSITRLADDE